MENIKNKELQPQPGERILSKIEEIQNDYIASRIKEEEEFPKSKMEKNMKMLTGKKRLKK